jgi:hypothetical protein
MQAAATLILLFLLKNLVIKIVIKVVKCCVTLLTMGIRSAEALECLIMLTGWLIEGQAMSYVFKNIPTLVF